MLLEKPYLIQTFLIFGINLQNIPLLWGTSLIETNFQHQ